MFEQILDELKSIKQWPVRGYSFKKIENAYWGYDNEGNVSFALESKRNDDSSTTQVTKCLTLNFNVECDYQIEGVKNMKKMHILTLKSDDNKQIETFIYLSISFSFQANDEKIFKYFSYLKILFSNSKRISEREMQGFYGELLCLLYFKQNLNFDLSKYYQSIDKMKFDFSITDKKKIEVKTTMKPSRIHHFRLEQLNTIQYEILIISILFQKDDQGVSLSKLIEKCKDNFKDNFIFLLHIEKTISNWSALELDSIRFNFQKAYESLVLFNAVNLPRILEKTNEGIFNVEYDSDLSNVNKLAIEDLKKLFNI